MGYDFFGEKIIFPSTPIPCINNDESLFSQNFARFSLAFIFYKLSSGDCLAIRVI